MLHYPRHVSSSTMLIFRKSYCIITTSGIVTLCKRPYSRPVESSHRTGHRNVLSSAFYEEFQHNIVDLYVFSLLHFSFPILSTFALHRIYNGVFIFLNVRNCRL